MHLATQPNLVERIVFDAVRADDSLRSEYERQFSDCYQHRDIDERDRAFAQLHERLFGALGMRKLVLSLAGEFPHFIERVCRLLVTQAPHARLQTAELFGAPGRYAVVIAVAPATLLDRNEFGFWARHEFLHIDDMLDPEFGFDLGLRPRGATTAAKNLTQDRYAVLWALHVDARLEHRGQAPDGVMERRRTELNRVFELDRRDSDNRIFNEMWERAKTSSPNHRELLDCAENGLPEFRDDGEEPSGQRTALPGSPCALCGFPTFDWATEDQLDDQTRCAILVDFSQWVVDQPVCNRCAEIYSACGATMVGGD